MTSDALLDRALEQWRTESLQAPRPEAIDRARQAMLMEVAATTFVSRSPLRGIRRGMIAALAAVMATTVTAGWNAPAGTALHVVRAAREGVVLALPWTQPAAVHLRFAEQYLADATSGRNRMASLAAAASDLGKARSELPSDHSSSLWTELNRDQQELDDAAGNTPTNASPTPEPTPTPEQTERSGPSPPPSDSASSESESTTTAPSDPTSSDQSDH